MDGHYLKKAKPISSAFLFVNASVIDLYKKSGGGV